jgi:hypothetical protein
LASQVATSPVITPCAIASSPACLGLKDVPEGGTLQGRHAVAVDDVEDALAEFLPSQHGDMQGLVVLVPVASIGAGTDSHPCCSGSCS